MYTMQVSSYEEVYSHRGLRYLARKYAEAYIDPEDLIQEAALAVWQKIESGNMNPHYLFNTARSAMQQYARRGKSVDRAWEKSRREQPIHTQHIDDVPPTRKKDAEGEWYPMEGPLGKDERADQFPALIALRDIIDRIYAYDGYSEKQCHILEMHRRGIPTEEIKDRLNLSTNQYDRRMYRLRIRIIQDALDGRKLPDPDPLPDLTERQREIYELYNGRDLSQTETANNLGISKGSVSSHLVQIQYKIAMMKFGLRVNKNEGRMVDRCWLN